jgi:hypothetical protein
LSMRLSNPKRTPFVFFLTTSFLVASVAAGSDDDGQPSVLPPFESRPFTGAEPFIYNKQKFSGRFKGTGPFRRTAILAKYSGVVGIVSLPCTAAKLRSAANGSAAEIGFVYVGGWGAGDVARAVDAGFQKSSIQDGNRDDNYSLIMFYDGPNRRTNWQSALPRLRCGQDVRFDFRPVSRTQLRMTASGQGVDGQRVDTSLTRTTADEDGWWPEGDPTADETHGVILKRMTTIGQTKDVVQRSDWDRSGSFFGHHSDDTTPRIVWKSMFVGRYDGSKWSWVPWDAAQAERVQDSWPDASRAQSVTGNHEEATAIDLHSTDR